MAAIVFIYYSFKYFSRRASYVTRIDQSRAAVSENIIDELFLRLCVQCNTEETPSLRSSCFLSFSRWRSKKRAKKRASEGACLGCAKNWGDVVRG